LNKILKMMLNWWILKTDGALKGLIQLANGGYDLEAPLADLHQNIHKSDAPLLAAASDGA
jgi:hypothetical protein